MPVTREYAPQPKASRTPTSPAKLDDRIVYTFRLKPGIASRLDTALAARGQTLANFIGNALDGQSSRDRQKAKDKADRDRCIAERSIVLHASKGPPAVGVESGCRQENTNGTRGHD